jgi:serine/threonine-protein kinase
MWYILRCRSVVDSGTQTVSDGGEPVAFEHSPPDEAGEFGLVRTAPPSRVGRYIMADRVGRGGLGEVYAARDIELDRTVAIKLPRTGRRTSAVDRMLDEARAMARVSSPNVVEVFDVGLVDGQVFIAMEFVEGMTLDRWCSERRPTREVVQAFGAAGRGLLAAHRAGLVHRDFKPSNVLVGRDGTVRVTDFGLATAVDTGGGNKAGTPRYMAPEQRRGESVDPRTDQFAFCSSMLRLLHGRLDVPARLGDALRRGIRQDPGERWPSMEPLLGVLDRAFERRWGRWAVAALLLAGGVGGAWWARQAEPESLCSNGRTAMDSTWNATRAAGVERALSEAGGTHDAAAELGAWANAWTDAWTQACEPSFRGHDAATLCLTEDRRRFAAVVGRLGAADRALAERSRSMVARLEPARRCLDANPSIVPRPDAAIESVVDSHRATLAEVEADELAGDIRQGRDRLGVLLPEVHRLDYEPLLAETYYRRGRLQERAGAYQDAAESFETAYFSAARVGDIELQVDASTMLVTVEGIRLQHPQAAEVWLRHGNAAVKRLGDRVRAAALEVALAGTEQQRGRLDAARRRYASAAQTQRELLGPRHPTLAATVNNLAAVVASQGDLEAAERRFSEAVEVFEASYGPSHPHVAGALANLGTVLAHRGRTREAIDMLDRALGILERRLGEDNPSLAPLLVNLGRQRLEAGEAEAAEAVFSRVLALRESALEGAHPEVAYAKINLGDAKHVVGDVVEAQRLFSEALAVLERAEGGVPWRAGYAHAGLARLAATRGNHDEARASFGRALRAYGSEAPAEEREAVAEELEELGHSTATSGRSR